MSAALAFALAILANVVYLAASPGEGQQVAHYVTSGAALCVAAVWLCVTVRSPVARIAFAWLAWEQAQVAICGIGSYGIMVGADVSGLCAAQYGRDAYLAGAATAIIAALAHAWSRRRGRTS